MATLCNKHVNYQALNENDPKSVTLPLNFLASIAFSQGLLTKQWDHYSLGANMWHTKWQYGWLLPMYLNFTCQLLFHYSSILIHQAPQGIQQVYQQAQCQSFNLDLHLWSTAGNIQLRKFLTFLLHKIWSYTSLYTKVTEYK